jgi:hypothetical protein
MTAITKEVARAISSCVLFFAMAMAEALVITQLRAALSGCVDGI